MSLPLPDDRRDSIWRVRIALEPKPRLNPLRPRPRDQPPLQFSAFGQPSPPPRGVQRRTVPVTQVFEAATKRMMMAPRNYSAGSFISAGDLAGGVAIAAAPPAPAIKTREKGSRLSGSHRIGARYLRGASGRSHGSHCVFATFAPQACQEIYLAWKDHDAKLSEERQSHSGRASAWWASLVWPESNTHATSTATTEGGRVRRFCPLQARKRQQY